MVVLLNFWPYPYVNFYLLYLLLLLLVLVLATVSPDTTLSAKKLGRHNRMLLMCRAVILDMSATDTNVCRLGGVADRHICDIASQDPVVVR